MAVGPARPVLLGCKGISKSFGERPVFERLDLAVHEGDHIGLVGPNGAGKTTLLRILASEETPDAGECIRRKSLRVAHVPQHPEFEAGSTAETAVARALSGDSGLADHERDQRVAVALSRVGIAEPSAEVEQLSGGWRNRLAMACAIALEPDLLLLDEPTNHLDIDSILWLESFLTSRREAFVAISHDRRFLQRVATRMLDIDRAYPAGLLAVDGPYADLLEAREELLSRETSRRESLANRVRREVAWLRRGAKARTSKSRSRIQAAERSIEELAESRERSRVATVGIELAASGRKTKRLWSCEGLGKTYDGRAIVRGLDLVLTPGMRIGVIGANGSGKSTLLRMIVGELPPSSGAIRHADALRIAYFDQDRRSLDPTLTLKRALAPEGDSVVYRDRSVHVVTWARRFGFEVGQLETPVSRLSGGERARIVLARLMLQPADLLVLDEPTNDLDIPTLEVLEDTLVEFPGALVLVTHDRFLIERVSTEIRALDGRGGVERFADYDQWEAGRGAEQASRKSRRKSPGKPVTRSSAKKLSYLEQREWDGMEERVLSAEAGLKQARSLAEDPAIASDAQALQERLAALTAAQAEVERLYARWAELERATLPKSGD